MNWRRADDLNTIALTVPDPRNGRYVRRVFSVANLTDFKTNTGRRPRPLRSLRAKVSEVQRLFAYPSGRVVKWDDQRLAYRELPKSSTEMRLAPADGQVIARVRRSVRRVNQGPPYQGYSDTIREHGTQQLGTVTVAPRGGVSLQSLWGEDRKVATLPRSSAAVLRRPKPSLERAAAALRVWDAIEGQLPTLNPTYTGGKPQRSGGRSN